MEKYLKSSDICDTDSEFIRDLIVNLKLDGLSQVEKAIKLFYYVRDSIRYSVIIPSFDRDSFRASHTLKQNTSYCIPKAIALSTLARAVGIPARLHFVDFINHRLSEKLTKLWGTNLMAGHCFSELYLNGKWVKATPALDLRTCTIHGFIPVEFDGENDAMLPSHDKWGNPHVEYVNDHGTFDHFPYEHIMKIMIDVYGMELFNTYTERIKGINTFD